MAGRRSFSRSNVIASFLLISLLILLILLPTGNPTKVKDQNLFANSLGQSFKSKPRRTRFLQSRVLYDCNSTPSFNLPAFCILLSNDVELNPGDRCKNQRSISVFYQNARSLKALLKNREEPNDYTCKLALLQDIVYSAKYDVVAISETWLNPSVTNSEILPHGYEIYRKDRDNRTGGGVLLAVKENIAVKSCLTLPGETVAIEIKLASNKLLLFVVCYRAPNDREFLSQFKIIADTASQSKYSMALITGDFNYPGIRWVNGSGFVNSDVGPEYEFVNLLSDGFLYQLVESPTREENILDLILSNNADLVDTVFVDSTNGLPSDHNCIYFDFFRSPKLINSPFRYVYDIKNADFESLRDHLLSNAKAINNAETDNALQTWKNDFFKAVNNFVPRRKVRHSQRAPWIDCDLAYAIKKKKTFWKNKVRRSKDPSVFEEFKKMRQRIKNWIRASRKAYLTRIASEIHSNAKPFWSFFKLKSSRRSYPDTMLLDDNTEVTSDLEKAKAFSEHFRSIYTDHSLCSFPASTSVNHPTLSEIVITRDEVLAELKGLNVTKATGPDEMPARLIVECADAIASPVCDLFNLSLSSGKFFSAWKDANLIPLFKKGKRAFFTNYRGISLLPILSKVLEKCVALRLVHFMAGRLFHLQHSFRVGLSCTTQLLASLHEIGKALDNGYETDIIYLDLTRAFDTVCHAHLLQKLCSYGIAGPLYNWFADYLSSRRQRVVVNGTSSPWEEVRSGVPQGSVLGPILFIIYINDLPDCLSFSSAAMFADDTKCFKAIIRSDDVRLLQQDLNSLSEWASNNELRFQPAKCENLRITRKRNSPQRSYVLNGVTLKIVTTARDLGVQVSHDLTWADHITIIVAKANRMLGFLRRHCSGGVSYDTQKTLYVSLVRSHLTYASQVWTPCLLGSIHLMRSVERVQRRATRFILRDQELDYQSRLIHLNLLPLSYFFEYLDLVFLFRCFKSEILLDSSDFVQFNHSRTRHGSSGLDLSLNTARTSTFRESFFVRICPLWNALPLAIRISACTSAFKSCLKSLLFDRLRNIYDADNIRTWRIICPICRRANVTSACSC